MRRRYRRRNPNGLPLAYPAVVPGLAVPLPGIVGTIVNGVIQGAAAGAVVFGSYTASGFLVDLVYSKETAAADSAAGKFLGDWGRPLLFGATAGLTGGVFAMLAPRGSKTVWGVLGAAGPGLRSIAGIFRNIVPATATGFVADLRSAAGNLADYLQVGHERNMDYEYGDRGMNDYLQVEGPQELYQAGMEEIYEAGLGMEPEEEYAV